MSERINARTLVSKVNFVAVVFGDEPIGAAEDYLRKTPVEDLGNIQDLFYPGQEVGAFFIEDQEEFAGLLNYLIENGFEEKDCAFTECKFNYLKSSDPVV